MMNWITNTAQGLGHTDFPISTILFYAAVITVSVTFMIFIVLIKIIPVFRRGEEDLYEKATKTIPTANGKGCEFELNRASVSNEMSLYGILMFCFICIACFVSYFFGATNMLLMAIASGALWVNIYVSVGWTEVLAKEFIIIEEYGNFKRAILPGPRILCLPGIVDKKTHLEYSTKREGIKFFQGEMTNCMVDFTDGYSASTEMTVYFDIDNPILWVYRINEAVVWLEDQIFRVAQQCLEEKDLAYATSHKIPIAKDVLGIHLRLGETEDTLEKQVNTQLGIKLTSFIINDIDIPQEIKDMRMEERRGIVDSEKRVAKAKGYEKAIQAIRDTYEKIYGKEMSRDDAKKVYDENQNREMLSGANVTIMGGDIQNMVKTLIGGKK